jgi:FkbM family methyltransferase
MLIPFKQVVAALKAYNISIRGILHIGAHECEELGQYVAEGIRAENIDWVEANSELVMRMQNRGIKVHHAAISDVKSTIPFYITNNGESSSLLEFGTHATSYPGIKIVRTVEVNAEPLSDLIERAKIPIAERNFWNLDIQGVELRALKSAGEHIQFADALYIEVETVELYKGCSLLHDVDEFLKIKGFVRKEIAMTDCGWGDALYIRESKI